MDDTLKTNKNARMLIYELEVSNDDIDHKFTEYEKEYLRPIAETLAMLDGNAFFEVSETFWESYLPEARAVFTSNGGLTGWASGASWIKEMKHENPAVEEAYRQYRILKSLSKKD